MSPSSGLHSARRRALRNLGSPRPSQGTPPLGVAWPCCSRTAHLVRVFDERGQRSNHIDVFRAHGSCQAPQCTRHTSSAKRGAARLMCWCVCVRRCFRGVPERVFGRCWRLQPSAVTTGKVALLKLLLKGVVVLKQLRWCDDFAQVSRAINATRFTAATVQMGAVGVGSPFSASPGWNSSPLAVPSEVTA